MEELEVEFDYEDSWAVNDWGESIELLGVSKGASIDVGFTLIFPGSLLRSFLRTE